MITSTGPQMPRVGAIRALRIELADLAFELERRGRLDAADLAAAIAGRLGQIEDAAEHERGRVGTDAPP